MQKRCVTQRKFFVLSLSFVLLTQGVCATVEQALLMLHTEFVQLRDTLELEGLVNSSATLLQELEKMSRDSASAEKLMQSFQSLNDGKKVIESLGSLLQKSQELEKKYEKLLKIYTPSESQQQEMKKQDDQWTELAKAIFDHINQALAQSPVQEELVEILKENGLFEETSQS